jgi:hypothetical protein
VSPRGESLLLLCCLLLQVFVRVAGQYLCHFSGFCEGLHQNTSAAAKKNYHLPRHGSKCTAEEWLRPKIHGHLIKLLRFTLPFYKSISFIPRDPRVTAKTSLLFSLKTFFQYKEPAFC